MSYNKHLRLISPTRRTGISKALRLRVFRFDDYTCQYCGAQAPDVQLEVDHVRPLAAGGDHSRANLVTACADCNRGKGSALGVKPARIHRAEREVLDACEVEMQATADDPEFWPAATLGDEPLADPRDVAWLTAHCGTVPAGVL